ncbi:MAG TPA: VCBS repeat-containing protein [Candidatus Sulfotelmatobacter sp.]|nr:VCBS repeat-containing protein [Candidatus Sulfotelmatobacter sp.]
MKAVACNLGQALMLALCTLLTLVTNAGAQELPSFVAHKEFGVGIAPSGIAEGDLNGDGITDLIIAESDLIFLQQQVVEVLGNPDGSFQAPVVLNSGSLPTSHPVIADFNGDGKNDVALTNNQGVVILLGNGKGGFAGPVSSQIGSATSLTSGDFNGDHRIDLAVVAGDNSVSLLLGNGDGTFQAPITSSVANSPEQIAAGDFNGDGRLDLALTGFGGTKNQHNNTVAILLGKGNGDFQPASFISVATQPEGIAIADMNHDGKFDVVITNAGTDQVSVLLGKGDGTFLSPKEFTVRSGPKPNDGYQPTFVAVDDFNGDGNPDLVVSSRLTSTATVLRGDGHGNLSKPTNFLVATGPVAVLSGDYNRDGKRDFLTLNGNAATISVFFGNGKTFQVETGLPAANRADQLVLADFNEDGVPDIATANSGIDSLNGNTASVLIRKKGGGLIKEDVIRVGTNPLSLVSGDFNHDGHQDLVVANSGIPNFFGTGTLSIILGNGDGTFQPPSTFNIIQPPGNFARSPRFVTAADFNQDGDLDVVACTDDAKGPSFLPGDGKGSFGKPILISLGSDCLEVEAADLNRDGKADLIIRIPPDPFLLNPSVFVALGNGDGTFTKPKILTRDDVFGFAIGDLNNDGILDLVLTEPSATKTLLGDGQGNFVSQGFFPGPGVTLFHNSLIPAIGDFNGDGFVDVAIADEFSQITDIVLGNGDGTLQKVAQLYAGGGNESASLVAGDLNADGKTDLALSGLDPRSGKGVVTQLINNTAK